MSISLNKPKLDNLAGDIWKSAERLRGKFKAYEYQNVILPIIIIRRLECVLLKWREDKRAEVLAEHNHPSGSLEPSAFDVEATKQLKAAGTVMGIALLDHIIFNRSGYFSFLEAGRL
jgi:type I restriction-modification system DNA methylase subunit